MAYWSYTYRPYIHAYIHTYMGAYIQMSVATPTSSMFYGSYIHTFIHTSHTHTYVCIHTDECGYANVIYSL